MGRVRHPGAGHRRRHRHLPGQQLRARGQGPRRARGDGRHLLQGRHDPADRRAREIARLGGRDRQRLVGRTRRPDHPDRLGDRLDAGPDHPDAGGPAHHPGRRRRRRGHRRDLQHADRRRDVRHRTDAAGGERRHLPAGRDRDRRGDVRRALVLRRSARLPGAADRGDDAARQHRARCCSSTRSSARSSASPRRGSSAACMCVEDAVRPASPGAMRATCSACCWWAC